MAFVIGNFSDNFLPNAVKVALANDNIPVYGVRFDGTNSAGTRLYNAAGKAWQRSTHVVQGQDDFSGIAPFNVKECITQYNSDTGKREVLAYKGDSNWNTLVTNKTGDRMIEFPCFWYSRPSKYEFLISPQAKVGFKPSPMHYRNGVLHDTVRVTKYAVNNNYVSQTGEKPRVSTDMNTFRSNLRNKGMYLLDYPTWCSITMLSLVKYANMDVQNTVGQGISTGETIIASGGADSVLGLDGAAGLVVTRLSVVTHGIENLYSNVWKFIDGLYGYGGYLYYKDLESMTLDPISTSELTSDYTKIGTTYPTIANKSPIGDISFDNAYDFGLYPTAVGSGDSGTNPTAPYMDGCWFDSNFNCVMVGGGAWDGSTNGLFCFRVDAAVGSSYSWSEALALEF